MPDRFQNQKWYVKLYRLRWRLLIPYWFLVVWWDNLIGKNRLKTKLLWRVAKSVADSKMKYWYTQEEVFGKIKKEIEKRYKGS